jgi:hypothetical protein
MHGVNTAVRSACAFRLRTPRNPFSPDPASKSTGSPLALFCPEPDPRHGLSLARVGCASRRLHPGVKAPGLQLPIRNLRLPGPFGSSAPLPRLVRPNPGPLHRLVPVAGSSPVATDLPENLTPLRGFCPPQDQSSVSVQPLSPPTGFARSPFAPRSPLCYKHQRLRINVPGPLRFRRPAGCNRMSHNLFVQPRAFRHCLLQHCLPAVLSPASRLNSVNMCNSVMRCVPRMICNFPVCFCT